ncbi:MAG: 2-hydroxychromene-2-carboxylate isomerase [Paracoccaceae bacterium]
MSAQVEFIYDFGSPNAYLAHRVLTGIAERADATIVYRPCLLGGIFKATCNQSPFMAYANIKGKLNYERLEIQRFIQRYGLSEFQMNPNFPVNTLLQMRGAVAAQAEGVHDIYFAACMAAMWEQGLKMDDPEVFAGALTDAGLDGQALLARTQEPEVKQGLVDNTAAAVDRGVFGIPSFFVGDEMFFGKERLGQVEDELQKT